MLTTIYILLGEMYGDSGSWPIRTFTIEDAANHCAWLCEEYNKTWHSAYKESKLKEWHAEHPAGEDSHQYDKYVVREIILEGM